MPTWVKLVVAAFVAAPVASFADDKKDDAKKPEKPGNFLQAPADGSPWVHVETGLAFPQKLGDFVLSNVFKDKRVEAGIALTYVMPKSDMKADVVLFPCQTKQITPDKVIPIVRAEHERLVSDLVAMASKQGYAERTRSNLEEGAVKMFDKGNLPLLTQTIDFVSAGGDPKNQPPLNEWVGLSLYADYFVQLHLLMPAQKEAKPEDAEKTRKQADQIITLLIHCLKEPSVVPEMLKLCVKYMDHPIEEEGRAAADALLVYSKESPVFEIALPGEVITPALDEINARSPDTSLDLLRAFVVGSSVVRLQHGTMDQALAEGTRLLGEIREVLRKNKVNVDSQVLDELLAASKEGKAAEFIHARMQKEKPAN